MIERSLILVLFVSAALHSAWADESKCSSGTGRLEDHFAQADTVFLGRLVNITGSGAPWWGQKDLKFEVRRTIKGPSIQQAEVRSMGGSDCLTYKQGEFYLVYARTQETPWSTNYWAGTKAFNQAQAEWRVLTSSSEPYNGYHLDGRCLETIGHGTAEQCSVLDPQDFSTFSLMKSTEPIQYNLVNCTQAQLSQGIDYLSREGMDANGRLRYIPWVKDHPAASRVIEPSTIERGSCSVLENKDVREKLLILKTFIRMPVNLPIQDSGTPPRQVMKPIKVLSFIRFENDKPSKLLAQSPSDGDADSDIDHICALDSTGFAQIILDVNSSHWGLWYSILRPSRDFSIVEERRTSPSPCQPD